MLFRDVIGQKEVKDRLLRSAREHRVSHALLFAGPEGTGKLALALAFARYLNCSQPGPEDACGTCPSCHKINKLVHPDIHFAFPIVSGKKSSSPVCDQFLAEWRQALIDNPYITLNQWVEGIGDENKQALIYAGEAAEIVKKLSLKSFEAPNKVMILWLPERMNVAAANKLLKLIEEPPPRTFFFLVTENPEQILLTIRSRSQLVKVPRVNDADLEAWLTAYSGLDEAGVRKILRLANGDAAFARSLLKDSSWLEEFHGLFTDFLRKSFSAKLPELVAASEKLGDQGREKLRQLLVYGEGLLRQSLMIRLGAPGLSLYTDLEQDFVTKFSKVIHEGNAPTLIEEINKAHFHISRNGYPKLIMLDLSLALMRIFHSKS